MKTELKKRAYREAAALLHSDCDSADLQCDDDESVTQDEASEVREFIRKNIVDELQKKGGP
jgi:hypothetical protein